MLPLKAECLLCMSCRTVTFVLSKLTLLIFSGMLNTQPSSFTASKRCTNLKLEVILVMLVIHSMILGMALTSAHSLQLTGEVKVTVLHSEQ